jgi:hypothetical protein
VIEDGQDLREVLAAIDFDCSVSETNFDAAGCTSFAAIGIVDLCDFVYVDRFHVLMLTRPVADGLRARQLRSNFAE